MMPAKYYIYAGGRWCEVDTRRGRVAGFRQRARFCFLRGGKLEVGRSTAVLKALRALVTGAGGAALDSTPLQGRRPHRSRRESPRLHHCCSQHIHHSRCYVNANELNEKPHPALTATERKRKRSTSEDTHKPKQARKEEHALKETQCQTSPRKTVKEIQSLVSSSEDGREEKIQSPQKKKTGVIQREKEEEKLVQTLLQSSSEESSKEQKQRSPQKPKPGPKVQGKEELVHTLQNSSEDTTERKKQSPQKKPGPRVRGKEQRSSDSGKEKSQKKKLAQKKIVRSKEEEKLVQSLLESSSSDNEQVATKPAKSDVDTDSSSSKSSVQRQGCKELVIDDSDVRLLRGFLARGAGGAELRRFDNDEEYKTKVFYKLNPLVIMKRCGPLEQLLLQRLSLKEFARHLGLRSVADVTPEKRYRMRHSTRQARNTTSVTSESEKEKTVQPKRRQLWNRDKEVFNRSRSSRPSELNAKPQIHRPQEGSDSDSEVKKHIKKHLARRASARSNPRREEKETKTNKDTDSVVVESSTDGSTSGNSDESDTDENVPKSRRRTRGMKENESVVISDNSDSKVGDTRRKSRRSTRGNMDDNKSVSESDSDVDNRGKSKSRTRAKSKNEDDNESVVISDESDSNTDENMDGNLKSGKKARSETVLREQNKSVVITTSDDTDSDSRENRARTKAKPETAKAQSKSVVASDSNNTDGKGTRRTRSRGPDRALKEHNSTTDKVTKTDRQAKKDDSTETKKITRSSIKGADDSRSLKDNAAEAKKEKHKKENTKSNKVQSREAKETKKDEDKSITSDSDDTFETKVSPKKKSKDVTKPLHAASVARYKGRFIKRSVIESTREKHSEKEMNERSKASEREKALNNKSDKHISDREGKKDKTDDKDNKENKRKGIEKMAAVARNMFVKPVKFKKSSVASGREYTSLEDHAIVAWVSVANRERRVNGNAVWRELELQYERLTSQKRSWHSLRNRYLRYILPALGALALPPAQVSRLRAAAATGSMKQRAGLQRNSIFSAPRVRSAAAAGRIRVRPVSGSDSDGQSDEKERTPPRGAPPSPARPPPATRGKATPPAKAPPPAKASSPRKAPPPASPPRHARLRARSSAAASTPKKKRIHHL